MCDYSLHSVKNRLAVQGEALVVHRFRTGSKGLASPADLEAVKPRGLKRVAAWFGFTDPYPARNIPAVCVPPGAKLYVEGIPDRIRADYALSDAEEATFTQVTAEPFRYRDAVRFDNGVTLLLQDFEEGIGVEVLKLALEEPKEAAANPVERRISANV